MVKSSVFCHSSVLTKAVWNCARPGVQESAAGQVMPPPRSGPQGWGSQAPPPAYLVASTVQTDLKQGLAFPQRLLEERNLLFPAGGHVPHRPGSPSLLEAS